jgi:hypothetical protein
VGSLLRVSLILVCCLMLVQCSDDSCVRPGPLDLPEPDVTVPQLLGDKTLEFGQTILISQESLYITFGDVSEGRCPTGALCFWEGEAVSAFWIVVPDRRLARVELAIRPSSEPMRSPETIGDALGYRFMLVRLDPYPDCDHRHPDEDYVAVLRVFKMKKRGKSEPISPPDPVIISSYPPIWFQRDPVTVLNGSIKNDALTLLVSHGGGCGKHAYKLFWRPGFMESYPVQTNLFLQHVNISDPCEAIITPVCHFDIREIAERYAAGYGGFDDIILNIYGYFEDEPGSRIQVTYSPE